MSVITSLKSPYLLYNMQARQLSFPDSLIRVLSPNSLYKHNMWLEDLPVGSSQLRRQVHELLSIDKRIEAFNLLEGVSDSYYTRQDYIDAVLFAARFLLGNQLVNECYIFLKVSQDHLETAFGEPVDFTLVEEIGNMFYLSGQSHEAIK